MYNSDIKLITDIVFIGIVFNELILEVSFKDSIKLKLMFR
jgi:hypothetical protein